MSFEITGKLHKKYDSEIKGASFNVREFVLLTEDEQYPQYIKFQLTQDRCNLLDQYEEGNKIKVHFDLRGREWQEKYFTNLNAWRLETFAGASDSANNSPSTTSDGNAPAPSINDMPSDVEDEMGDLPF